MLLSKELTDQLYESKYIPDNLADAIKRGDNIFLTGGAGTGKSTISKELSRILGEYITLTSSTGISALNIGGTTIHRAVGIGICGSTKELDKILSKDRWPIIRASIQDINILLIDEISMISKWQLDLISAVMSLACGLNRDIPFGGKQVIFVGDFLQLPPVISKMQSFEVKKTKSSELAFFSKAWEAADLTIFPLTKIWRQDNIDFKNMLNDIRIGNVKKNHKKELDLLKVNNVPTEENEMMRFFPRRDQAAFYNEKMMDNLKTPYIKIKTGLEKYDKSIKDDQYKSLALEVYDTFDLIIKEGCRVMCRKNTEDLVNGSLGTVISINKSTDSVDVLFDGHSHPLNISPMEHDIVTTDGDTIGKMLRIPLTIAYAVTIHKSQGLTLDKAYIHLKDLFAPGQGYVGLSRVKSINGLHLPELVDSDMERIVADKHAVIFTKAILKANEILGDLGDYKKDERKEFIYEIVDHLVSAYDIGTSAKETLLGI